MWTSILSAMTSWSKRGYPIQDEALNNILDEAGNAILSEGDVVTAWTGVLNE